MKQSQSRLVTSLIACIAIIWTCGNLQAVEDAATSKSSRRNSDSLQEPTKFDPVASASAPETKPENEPEKGIEDAPIQQVREANSLRGSTIRSNASSGNRQPKDESAGTELAHSVSPLQTQSIPKLAWIRPNLLRHPLYFEEPELERQGCELPEPRQSIQSAAKFLGRGLIHPFAARIYRPFEFIHDDLGWSQMPDNP